MTSKNLLSEMSQRWRWTAVGVAVLAATVSASGTELKEANFGTLAVTAEQAYDSNVFRVSHGPLQNQAASVSTGTLRWEKARGGTSVRYALEAVRFGGGAASEDHARQNAAIVGSGTRGCTAWDFSSQTLAVDGEDASPRFGSARSCFAITSARERRDQWQNRSAAAWRIMQGRRFLRMAATFTGYDLHTVALNEPGVDNYVDRSDLNGGVDLGAHRPGGFAAWFGYRRGRQFQDRDGGKLSARSNHYDWLALGADGRLLNRLRIVGQLGPEKHHYARGSTGPVEIERLHVDVAATWDVGPNDALLISTKRLQAVASTGNVSSQDYSHAALWRHRLANAWSAAAGLKVGTGIYDGSIREDWLTTSTATVTWRPRAATDITFTYLNEMSRDQSGLHDATREFHRAFVSLAGAWTF